LPEIVDFTDLPSLMGRDLGSCRWLEVTQEQVSAFAKRTGDQRIHLDPEPATDGPFGSTIAHGFFVLSCATRLLYELVEVHGSAQILKYGLNRVRLTAPTPIGSRIQMGLKVTDVAEVSGGNQLTSGLTFERDGQEKPVCVAELLFRYYGPAS
jgi:acyl dehydratase